MDLAAYGAASRQETAPSAEEEKRERKKIQNRIAQRNYRLNQRKRMLDLEAAVRSSQARTSFRTPPMETPRTFGLQSFVEPSQTLAQTSPDICRALEVDTTADEDPFKDLYKWSNELDPKSPTAHSSQSDQKEQQKKTPLHIAIRNGNESMTRLLLDRGADVTICDSNGGTALHLAAESGQEEIVQMVLERLSNPNVGDAAGRTALFRAVQSENEAIARVLLEANVDVNARDIWSNAALHVAVETGSESLVLLLIAHGALIDN